MRWFWTSYTINTNGKSKQRHEVFERGFTVANLTKNKQTHLRLEIKTSELFETASVELEIEANSETTVSLPHVPRAGSALVAEEIVTYALLQRENELCTTSATVTIRDHSHFCLEPERGPPIDFTQPFGRKIRVINNSTAPLPATATLSISRTACFQPISVVVGGEIAAGESRVVEVPHRPATDISLATIEECTSYTLKIRGLFLATIEYRARMYEYSAYLLRYRPSDGGPIRVLLFGRVGNGKTSFVRALFSALDPGGFVLCNLVPVAPTATTGTKNYEIYRCGEALPFVVLFDPWGHQPANYLNNECGKMIEGRVQPGSHMDRLIDEEESKNKIHSVVLFVSASSPGVDREIGIVAQALAKGHNPTIVMSLCESQLRTNEDVKKFRENPNALPDQLEVKRKALCALGPGAVLQVAPYVEDETTKVFERDRLSLRVLEQALHAGKSFQQFHPD